MTDSAGKPEYLTEIDTDQVDQLGADNPNVANRGDDAGEVDHEALMGEPVDDEDTAATDAAAASVEDDGAEAGEDAGTGTA